MTKLTVSVKEEIERKLRLAAESAESEPEILAAEWLERIVSNTDILVFFVSQHGNDHISWEDALQWIKARREPRSRFDEDLWSKTLARIDQAGAHLPQYPVRTFATDDF